ncbi:hypothetical protein ABZ128_09455 [Streptomyces sp. NPDC006326]|uniref:hypothetical protein n=1 Tax=Streptomyces sp. NPDC006326 TaxID=3156752 RepID=UPI0033BE1AFA
MSERTRDERIEAYYDESARSLATSLVDAEDEAARLRAALVELDSRLSWHTTCRTCSRILDSAYEETIRAERAEGERNRYRLAWLSARGRAADAYTYGAEAMDRKAAEIATLSAELRRHRAFADEVRRVRGKTMCAETPRDLLESHLLPVYGSLHELEDAERERRPFVPRAEREYAANRECTYGPPRLECAGTEEDGSTVWCLGSDVDGS